MIVSFLLQLITFLRLLLNHLINIPLIILAGGGKLVAVFLAFALDMFQATIYDRILSGRKVSQFFANFSSRILSQQNNFSVNHPKVFSWIKKLPYFGIFLLASMPVYTGGICAAVFLKHTLSLDRYKSWVAIATGSLSGCFIWVFGIQYIFKVLRIALANFRIL